MSNLPAKQDITFQDLIKDPIEAYKNDLAKKLFYQQPPKAWIKPHPFATKKVIDKLGTREVPAEYIPIDKIEFLLDRIFQKWRVEVLRESTMFNAITVTVRVHYRDIDGEWTFHDGVGAQQIQVKKGTSLADLSNINNAAVQIALGAAKSYAIKDACDHIGNLFGRNINRTDANYDFNGAYSSPKPPYPDDKTNERLDALMRHAKTRNDLKKFEKELSTPEQRSLYDELFKQLK